MQRGDDQPLLGAVVEVALDPQADGVGGGEDARARRLELGDPERLELALEPAASAARRSVMSKMIPSSHSSR